MINDLLIYSMFVDILSVLSKEEMEMLSRTLKSIVSIFKKRVENLNWLSSGLIKKTVCLSES